MCKEAMTNFHQECLEAHNAYRAMHGCPPLILDREMCNDATNHAQHMASTNTFSHRSNRKYGENLFMSMGQKVNGNTPVDSWYQEVKDYNFGDGGFSMRTGHFTQVIWRGSQRLGVGIATNGSKTFVVATYDPPGNFHGLFQQNVPRKIK